MHDYYCKNCNYLIGKWNDEYKDYDIVYYCIFTNSTNIQIKFLDCGYCNKFVGLLCTKVCENCFGKNIISEKEILFNWFLKHKKINQKYSNNCKICNKQKFRFQPWFFEELTFYKQ